MCFRKLGWNGMSKTCSPGSFPEGKVGDSGRNAGRWIVNIMLSVPEIVYRAKERQRERWRDEEKKRVSKRDRLDRTSFMNRGEEPGGCVVGGGGRHHFHKNNRPAVRKPPGRESGRENEKNHVWCAMAQGPNPPTLLAPHAGPPTLTFPCVLPWSTFPPKRVPIKKKHRVPEGSRKGK